MKINQSFNKSNYKNIEHKELSKSNKDNNITKSKEVTKSLYNSPCNISPNYYNPSFGLGNKQAALYRAKKIQEKYAKIGLNYLMPEKVWSTKKIYTTTNKAIEEFENLSQKNNITIESLNDLVKKILPQNIAKNIEIKDLRREYPQRLRSQGYSNFQIREIINSINGATSKQDNKSIIYLFTDIDTNSIREKLSLKETFVHELKHAITNNVTNIETSDTFKVKNPELENAFYDFFQELENTYTISGMYNPTKLNQETMIQNIKNLDTNKKFLSEKELKKDLEETIKNIQNRQEISKENFKTKEFYEYLQHYAKDEKEAYKTSKVYREYNSDKNTPVAIELKSLMYEFFEKYFKNQSKTFK
jgi:hypothetical protein